MPYVERDQAGKVRALTLTPDASREFLPPEHPEVMSFLCQQPGQSQPDTSNMEMLLSDLKMIRVIEDVIDLLIAKGVIIFSDLPVAVQHKILQKRGEREKLFGSNAGILNTDEGLL